MKLQGKKILIVIASSGFRDEEYAEPRRELEAAGATVTVASSALHTATGKLGLRVKPDVLIGNASAPDFDGIVFVGGPGSKEYFDDPVAHQLARTFFADGKLTSAICIAPAILANAGILKGRRATCFPSSEGILKAKGATFTGRSVECDDMIVTAVGPEAATEFGEKLVELLGNRLVAAKDRPRV